MELWQQIESGFVAEQTKREAASIIAAKLLHHLDGGVNDPAAWERLARRLGIIVSKLSSIGARRGYSVLVSGLGYSEPNVFGDSGLVCGKIFVNDTQGDKELCEVWVHELAHLFFAAWIPPQLSSRADTYSYDGDDKENVSHEIARMVESIILG